MDLLEKKLHNVQRTKLSLKNKLNAKIKELESKIEETEEKYNYEVQKNKILTEKLKELKWASDWDNLEIEN
jgi:TolA-binding protein